MKGEILPEVIWEYTFPVISCSSLAGEQYDDNFWPVVLN